MPHPETASCSSCYHSPAPLVAEALPQPHRARLRTRSPHPCSCSPARPTAPCCSSCAPRRPSRLASALCFVPWRASQPLAPDQCLPPLCMPATPLSRCSAAPTPARFQPPPLAVATPTLVAAPGLPLPAVLPAAHRLPLPLLRVVVTTPHTALCPGPVPSPASDHPPPATSGVRRRRCAGALAHPLAHVPFGRAPMPLRPLSPLQWPLCHWQLGGLPCKKMFNVFDPCLISFKKTIKIISYVIN